MPHRVCSSRSWGRDTKGCVMSGEQRGFKRIVLLSRTGATVALIAAALPEAGKGGAGQRGTGTRRAGVDADRKADSCSGAPQKRSGRPAQLHVERLPARHAGDRLQVRYGEPQPDAMVARDDRHDCPNAQGARQGAGEPVVLLSRTAEGEELRGGAERALQGGLLGLRPRLRRWRTGRFGDGGTDGTSFGRRFGGGRTCDRRPGARWGVGAGRSDRTMARPAERRVGAGCAFELAARAFSRDVVPEPGGEADDRSGPFGILPGRARLLGGGAGKGRVDDGIVGTGPAGNLCFGTRFFDVVART